MLYVAKRIRLLVLGGIGSGPGPGPPDPPSATSINGRGGGGGGSGGGSGRAAVVPEIISLNRTLFRGRGLSSGDELRLSGWCLYPYVTMSIKT